MSTVRHLLLTGALVPHTEHRCLGVAGQEFMGAALPWTSVASSSNFSETFSRATINFSSAEDKTRSRHPSCNKWGHRKMGSHDCRILNCGFTPSLGRHRLGGRGCVCVPYLRLFMGSGDTLKAPLSHPPAPLQWLREVGIGCRDLGGARERSWGLIAELSSVSLLFC